MISPEAIFPKSDLEKSARILTGYIVSSFSAAVQTFWSQSSREAKSASRDLSKKPKSVKTSWHYLRARFFG